MRLNKATKRIMGSRLLVAWSLCLAIGFSPLAAQDARSRQQQRLADVPKGLPSDVSVQAGALGNRLRIPGTEETVLTGQYLVEGGDPKTIRVTHQLSGMVRIEGLKHVPLTFDGDLPRGLEDRRDESLLETFVMDTIEGMIYSVRSDGALRLLGRRFGPDAQTAPGYRGVRYDIYEVTAPVRSRVDRQLRLKRYYFESDTSLLLSTRYTDPMVSPGLKVEIRFLNWQQVGGSAYPGVIERYENGRRVFSFVVATVAGQARQDATNFR